MTEIGLQGSAFDGGRPVVDEGLAGLRRIELDERSWVDHEPGRGVGVSDSRVAQTIFRTPTSMILWAVGAASWRKNQPDRPKGSRGQGGRPVQVAVNVSTRSLLAPACELAQGYLFSRPVPAADSRPAGPWFPARPHDHRVTPNG